MSYLSRFSPRHYSIYMYWIFNQFKLYSPPPTPTRRTIAITLFENAAARKLRLPNNDPAIIHGNSPTRLITNSAISPVKFNFNYQSRYRIGQGVHFATGSSLVDPRSWSCDKSKAFNILVTFPPSRACH